MLKDQVRCILKDESPKQHWSKNCKDLENNGILDQRERFNKQIKLLQ